MKMTEELGTKKWKKSGKTAMKVAAGVVIGAAAGAIAGILMAPDSGKNTRKKIADGTTKLMKDVKLSTTDKIKNVTGKLTNKTTAIDSTPVLEENLN